MKIIIVLMCCIAIGVASYAFNNAEVATKTAEDFISVSPITQERVETEKGRVLRVTYGKTVLEIPEKYRPHNLAKGTKSVIFSPLVWPNLTFLPQSDNDKYFFRIFIYPKNPLSNFDDSWRRDNFINNGYVLRQSTEYSPLMEYWSEQRQESNYFIVNYKPKYFRDFISCSPGYKEGLVIKEQSPLKMGDTSCSIYGVISESVVVKVRFDARLLPEGENLHQRMDQLISSFIVLP